MNVLVNALSLGSLSGRHVLYGHLRQLAKWTESTHHFHVLLNYHENPAPEGFSSNVSCIHAPALADGGCARAFWEYTAVNKLLSQRNADLYFTPSGTTLLRCSVPQVVLAQNPWSLTPNVPQGILENAKACLQRAAYRAAVLHARLLYFNSHYIENLYKQNANRKSLKNGRIAYQGINDDTFAAASMMSRAWEERQNSVLAVSTMAPWKNVETVVRAVAKLVKQNIDVHLRLVGAWPNKKYRFFIEREIARLQLENVTTIVGEVSRDQLHHEYAVARVFCLMSRCESFGIPAVEAQAFGTPVVGSDCCAMPEIGGSGGCFGPSLDADNTAALLLPFFGDYQHWNRYSLLARKNADRFRWNQCSLPLLEMFDSTHHDKIV